MKEKVLEIWPEINWIKNEELREKTLDAWVYAIESSPLEPKDLEEIPFSLLIKDCSISFMNHKRTCVQLAVDIAKTMVNNFGDEIKVDMDVMISGAILIDVGKLLEYEIVDGKLGTSDYGKVVRHPFSGVAIAARFGLPPGVQHIIGTHSKEGDLGKRTVESIIVHHADFVSFEPFKA
jgi:putative nucleotidyltransferase with HDIG domain|tara:strand:- start:508 stop:1041 length:534 start_codon:yes stop_codon:yes gene_type:complete